MVWGLIAVNTVLLLVAETLGGSQDLSVMLDLGAQPNPLPRSELWRMVTSIFLHFGLLHLAFNLYALWLFGPLLERFVGHLRFTALYLASGLSGSAASAAFTGPGTLSAGASGAIFGLLGAFAVLGLLLRDTELGRTWLRQALLLVGLNVVLGLSVESIGLEAHLGGLVGGAVVLLLMARRSEGPRPLERRAGSLGLIGSGILVAASLAIGFLAGSQAG